MIRWHSIAHFCHFSLLRKNRRLMKSSCCLSVDQSVSPSLSLYTLKFWGLLGLKDHLSAWPLNLLGNLWGLSGCIFPPTKLLVLYAICFVTKQIRWLVGFLLLSVIYKCSIIWLAKRWRWLTEKTPWPQSASELCPPIDLRLSAKLVPTFANRGCHVVSVTNPYGWLNNRRNYEITAISLSSCPLQIRKSVFTW
jgi:hypothetical protein